MANEMTHKFTLQELLERIYRYFEVTACLESPETIDPNTSKTVSGTAVDIRNVENFAIQFIVGEDIDKPTNVSCTVTNAGSSPDTTYYFVVTAITENGYESAISDEVNTGSIDPDGGATYTVSWDAVTGASKYRVYRGTSSGNYTEYTETTETSIDETATYNSGSTPDTRTVTFYFYTSPDGSTWDTVAWKSHSITSTPGEKTVQTIDTYCYSGYIKLGKVENGGTNTGDTVTNVNAYIIRKE